MITAVGTSSTRHGLGLGLLVLGTVSWLAACGDRNQGNPARQRAETAAEVSVTRIQPESHRRQLRLSSVFRAWYDVSLVAKSAGEVVAVLADLGDSLSAGDILLRIDDRVPANNVRRAEASLAAAVARRDQAQRDQRRKRQLADRRHAADAEIEAAQLAYAAAAAEAEAAAAALASVRIALNDTRCRAPFGGVVAARLVDPGATVSVGQPLFALVAADTLRVVVGVVEADLGELAVGMTATAAVPAWPGESFPGRIRAIGPRADLATGTFPVELAFRNDDRRLRPGMAAAVSLSLAAASQRILIPATALREFFGQPGVLVVMADTVRRRMVTLGEMAGDRRVVLSGLTAGDRLVFSPPPGLRDGQPVRVTGEDSRP